MLSGLRVLLKIHGRMRQIDPSSHLVWESNLTLLSFGNSRPWCFCSRYLHSYLWVFMPFKPETRVNLVDYWTTQFSRFRLVTWRVPPQSVSTNFTASKTKNKSLPVRKALSPIFTVGVLTNTPPKSSTSCQITRVDSWLRLIEPWAMHTVDQANFWIAWMIAQGWLTKQN
jgi:hypothetical protein